ncbi:hypothetical protein BFR57_02455 [Idiomarina sp. MD25a]|uniref:glycosyltransferase n=1 Tax=Idiomarina sp. MD25a TaxID=1889913 RepID=UPI0008F89E6B|nr:glycosyltransferase [Idiomarina sp. MD25a]OIM99446.1 hypothetical protein BFR57_02455 [Idiomarina sp. MD25a]
MNSEFQQRIIATLDENWYLEKYPDVTVAGITAAEHFVHHGIQEGRWPCENSAYFLESSLWENLGDEAELSKLKASATESNLNASWSSLVLARWFHSNNDKNSALLYINRFFELDNCSYWEEDPSPYLIAVSLFVSLGKIESAKQVLSSPHFKESNDKTLSNAMLLSGSDFLNKLNEVYQAERHLSALTVRDSGSPACLDNIKGHRTIASNIRKRCKERSKVSVIIPLFNAEQTIDTAISSLLNQSWQNLEVLVVDDCSTDQSKRRVSQWEALDSRVRLVSKEKNEGAYCARNDGLALASGDFITTHDADDWSHPDKIKCQVMPLLNDMTLMATVSHWVRTSESFLFNHWRIDGSLIYRNVSSLMFRRQVHNELGFWDRVNVNGDTEFYFRLIKKYGEKAIEEVLPSVPLAFGRMQHNSLSRASNTHLRTQYKGLRKKYHDASQAWHRTTNNLYVEKAPSIRMFVAPEEMLRATEEQHFHNRLLLLEESGFFDENWYASVYDDVASQVNDLLKHFFHDGQRELRDPNPIFSSSGFKYKYDLFGESQVINHAINIGVSANTLVDIDGLKSCDTNARHIALFAHWLSPYSFGAERSFLDVITALNHAGHYKMTVFLPNAANLDYVNQIRKEVTKVVFLPTVWWTKGRRAFSSQVSVLSKYFEIHGVELCYLNTCVLYEPLLAGKEANIPLLMHVRELPEFDPSLCERLNATHDEVREHILSNVDRFIVNSNAVKSWLKAQDARVDVIPNVSNINPVDFADISNRSRLRVGIASSNVEKKGLSDFIELAERAAKSELKVDFYIFGPKTAYLEQLLDRLSDRSVVAYAGYRSSPEDVMQEIDILVSFSLFKESFGRTVLEAFLAGRGVIAYDWGAISEVFPDESVGLIEYRNIDQALKVLSGWSNDRNKLLKTAKSQQQYAIEKFNKKRFQFSLENTFNSMLSDEN